MSAFEGLRQLRHHQYFNVGMALDDLVVLVRRVDADASALDFDAAVMLDKMVERSAPVDDAMAFYQDCIEAVIIRQQPVWVKIITLGRQKLVQKLSRDEQQCFRSSGLLADPPGMGVIAWWDRVAGRARLAADLVKLERARRAELLSLEHEHERLRAMGIDREPRLISIDDNTAGYDILSYDPGPTEPVNRLIEVKSTIASPLRFKVTRNEWNKACAYGGSYHFYVWDLQAQPPRLYERTAAEVAPHIPSDNARGRWESADVPVQGA